MKRRPWSGTAVAAVLLSGLGVTARAEATHREPAPTAGAVNGRIAFFQHDRDGERPNAVFTVDPRGGPARRLSQDTAAHPRWSPDGGEIAVDAEIDSPTQPSAVIHDVDTGSVRKLTGTLGRVCFVWSPDGSRLACSGQGLLGDPDVDPGITTIRSSDGGGLERVTDFSSMPGDYSPDGTMLSLAGVDPDGNLRMYVVRLDGTGLLALTPPDLPGLFDEDGGSWSPDGTQIIFEARRDSDRRRSLWSVRPDGTGLHELPIPGCGGLLDDPRSIACFFPSWSPDGREIVFDRFDSHTGRRNIYTVFPDGSRLTQVTNTGSQDEHADWGVHP